MIFKLNHVFFFGNPLFVLFLVSFCRCFVRFGGKEVVEEKRGMEQDSWFSSMKQKKLWFFAGGQLLSIVWPGCLLFRCERNDRCSPRAVNR